MHQGDGVRFVGLGQLVQPEVLLVELEGLPQLGVGQLALEHLHPHLDRLREGGELDVEEEGATDTLLVVVGNGRELSLGLGELLVGEPVVPVGDVVVPQTSQPVEDRQDLVVEAVEGVVMQHGLESLSVHRLEVGGEKQLQDILVAEDVAHLGLSGVCEDAEKPGTLTNGSGCHCLHPFRHSS